MENENFLGNDESIIATIRCHTDITDKTLMGNLLFNLFIHPISMVQNQYKLIITNKAIYIQHI